MIGGFERVLILAPHTDDGEFGCGGTITRLLEEKAEVRYVAFSIATKSLPEGFPPDTLAKEVRQATAEIGIPEDGLVLHDFEVRTFPERRQDILELLIELREDWRPDAVFMPSLHDVHQDHQVVAAEGLHPLHIRALRCHRRLGELFGHRRHARRLYILARVDQGRSPQFRWTST